ncbi:uncharacterized protein N7482_006927 [Penicillium canariense]|uniref:Uncharacterized protein n=1 Tax=Penicillium canariense TaxID=189055 RepID=A0A9W9HVY2_9EURO|nr:uncharacterized protein N7482_006927 [Penicillium canariense]KAJ5159923.1 hypothetical protein N7482_006927 [Penicillium canariense]
MGLIRAVAFCGLVTDLLQQLLDASAETRLIVCGTRTEFLVQLSAAIQLQRADPNYVLRHDLLTKTIGLLANASTIKLTFCPSLESLRAYLSVLVPDNAVSRGTESPQGNAMLAILDMVALHGTTTEFSAQGLSRTFAASVESASRAKMDLMLCECTNAVNTTSADWGAKLWDTQVPLLNGSVRLRGEEGSWGGRGVSVKQVAQRWFQFGEGKHV